MASERKSLLEKSAVVEGKVVSLRIVWFFLRFARVEARAASRFGGGMFLSMAILFAL